MVEGRTHLLSVRYPVLIIPLTLKATRYLSGTHRCFLSPPLISLYLKALVEKNASRDISSLVVVGTRGITEKGDLVDTIGVAKDGHLRKKMCWSPQVAHPPSTKELLSSSEVNRLPGWPTSAVVLSLSMTCPQRPSPVLTSGFFFSSEDCLSSSTESGVHLVSRFRCVSVTVSSAI